ncbi:peptidoglycan-binding domain-containing protein [Bifidobacterium moraviense]|nr:peptidoglycan-binding domain-containing protein [Bifidobacterium sp. DSM 109958]
MRRTLSWTAVAMMIALPLAGVGAFSHAQARDPEKLAPAPVAVLRRPTVVTDDGDATAVITVRRADAVTLTAPAWQGGVVTRVDAAPGDELVTGTPLLAIDGVSRLAVASAEPFHRALADGDAGPDVAMLETALGAMGLFAGTPDETYDDATAAAVRRLERRLGVQGEPSGVFDPLWFVWMPAERLAAAAVHAAVNDPVPVQGQTLLSIAAGIAAVDIATPTGDVDFDGTAWVLSQHGTDIATLRDGDDVNADLVARLAADDADESSTPTDTADGTREYTVGLRRETPVTMLSVPASAVMTGADGISTCVWGKTGPDDADYRSMPVTVAGGAPGISRIEPSEGLDDLYVLADPLAVMDAGSADGRPTCP